MLPQQSDTIDLVHSQLRDLLADEVALGDRLETRSTWVAGFAGVILALSLAARKALSDLNALAEPLQTVLFVVSASCLTLAALSALVAIWPRSYWHTHLSQVVWWLRQLGGAKSEIQGPALDDMVIGLSAARALNQQKVVRARAALVLLELGIATVAAQLVAGVLR